MLVKAERIALIAAKRLGERFPKLMQVGFDIGIDRNRRIWIIEGNYWPDLLPFRLLKDSSMYRRILWYRKHKSSEPVCLGFAAFAYISERSTEDCIDRA
ncbi:hypothetical protein FPZ49_28540 [Paenibacillus cremeus]|uniref:YheC/YheD family protein n=2 Tax=Paenibacillus cremeus TaxID=2163881 RepID=A0A559K323_9BACL|nr:YheC/YheD family protein [Paenibacillus cremeus]TVY06548.1 hypothetical protein FPZ49_28540 [Paenibacillus cremeus]